MRNREEKKKWRTKSTMGSIDVKFDRNNLARIIRLYFFYHFIHTSSKLFIPVFFFTSNLILNYMSWIKN